MSRPEITIIIPVHNGREFLRSAVLSVLADDLPSFEILVIDDGSTDDSLGVISDLPVVSLRGERNRGISHARNLGLRAARGELVTFVDQDDLLAPGGLSWRWRWLREHPEEQVVGGVVGGLLDRSGSHLATFEQMFRKSSMPPRSRLTLDLFRRGQSFSCALWLFLFRRAFLERIGELDESLLYVQDHDYIIRALCLQDIPFVNRPTILYRLHTSNTTSYLEQNEYRARRTCIAEAALVRLSYGFSLV